MIIVWLMDGQLLDNDPWLIIMLINELIPSDWTWCIYIYMYVYIYIYYLIINGQFVDKHFFDILTIHLKWSQVQSLSQVIG